MVTNIGEEIIPKNDAELMEMERLMRSAPEPAPVGTPEMADGVAMRSIKATSAGHVTMWNTDTREPAVFNLNAVRTKLKEVFPPDYENNILMRGRPCWTAMEPSEAPWRGTTTCLLHVDRPERATFDALGYPRCTYDVGANEMEVRRHLEKKHPSVFRMMQEALDATDKKAEASNRDVMTAILAKLAGAAVPSDKTQPAEEPVPEGFETFTGNSDQTFTITDVAQVLQTTTVNNPDITTTFTGERPPLPPLPKGQVDTFYCTRCAKNHREGSGIARRHKKHQA